VLLANLTSIGQVGVTYHDSLRQLLVLLPPYVASTQSFGLPGNNPTGNPMGEFSLSVADPPACTAGFLPPSQWRSPADTTEADTPDGLYCKLPQDAPISVRGARNYPCMGVPGKRAPTVQLCNDPMGFVPLMQRQHVLGPYPIDPNLLAQGIPPDDRIDPGNKLFGPLDGTPMPPSAGQPAAGPPPADGVQLPAPPGPDETPSAAPADDPVAAPSAFDSTATAAPSAAVVEYDPRTGKYATPDGTVRVQSDLVASKAPKSWKDLLQQ
jgi:phospholipid/cholesterol/gamma-HCH transport system substrate-binding protein